MPESPDAPVVHCPHCLEEVGERSHFCTACGMPISSYATIAPMEQVWALGWFVNRLLGQRPSGLAVAGVWLLALPSLLVLGGVPFSVAVANGGGTTGMVVAGGVSLLLAGCYLLLACRVTLAYFRGRRRSRVE